MKEKKYIQLGYTLLDVQKVVENYFIMDPGELISKNRGRNILIPRQLAHHWCYVNKEKYNWTLAQIGAYIGGKDHATVYHSYKTIEQLNDTKYIFDFCLISKHIENIKNDINADIAKKQQKAAMGTRPQTIRKTTGPFNNNQILPVAGMAVIPQPIHNGQPIMRRMFTTWQNCNGQSAGPHKTNKSIGSLRHKEREIRRTIERRKCTIAL